MRLRCLDLLNFKAYSGEHSVRLDGDAGLYNVRGVNNVAPGLGSNGAAKSSLFDAIAWVIWGKTLRDERPGSSVEPWTGDRPTIVALTYEHAGVEVCIKRGRRPNYLGMETNGNLATCDQAAVDRAFPLSFEVFRNTVALPQFGKVFLEMAAEEQSRFFSDTLGLDIWIAASDTASKLARVTREESAAVAVLLSQIDGRRIEIQANVAQAKTAHAMFKRTSDRIRQETATALADARKRLSAIPYAGKASPAPAARASGRMHTLVERGQLTYRAWIDSQSRVKQLDDLWAQAGGLLDALKRPGAVCPTCGQKVTAEHRKKEIAEGKAGLVELQERRKRAYDAEIAAKREHDKTTKAVAAAAQQLEASQRQAKVEEERAAITNEIRQYTQRLETPVINPHRQTLIVLKQRRDAIEEEQAKLLAQAREIESALASYTYWAEAYKKIRLQLIDNVLAALEQGALKHAESLGLYGWNLKLATERETQAGTINTGFSCLLYPPGKAEPVKYQAYCGGEFQRWSLALRFAMAELLLAYAGVDTNIEFLDEPVEHMSPEGIDDLLCALRERSRCLNRQIWFVDQSTHDASLFDGEVLVTHDAESARVALSRYENLYCGREQKAV